MGDQLWHPEVGNGSLSVIRFFYRMWLGGPKNSNTKKKLLEFQFFHKKIVSGDPGIVRAFSLVPFSPALVFAGGGET